MVMRAVTSIAFFRSKQLKNLIFNPFVYCQFLYKPRFSDVIHKVLDQEASVISYGTKRYLPGGICLCHSTPMDTVHKVIEPTTNSGTDTVANGPHEAKPKRKKLKGKRAIVRWLRQLRYLKKKEYQRMTAEEKILFKLGKAQRKEKRLIEAINKLKAKYSSETIHDPEILTTEEHYYFLKLAEKRRNYVPVGRRGLFQGVILNMHLHWKEHETLQVIVKTFTSEEIKEIAAELAVLSGGIVLDINEDTITMYRGKNYSQPPFEIMSPRVTIGRIKALRRSKYRDALRSVRRYIPALEQDLELIRAKHEKEPVVDLERQIPGTTLVKPEEFVRIHLEAKEKLKQITENEEFVTDSELVSDSEELSDTSEMDCETDEKPLYLNEFEKFPVENNKVEDDFEEYLTKISANSRKEKDSPMDFDEVDRVVLRAASLLKKKR